MKVLPVLFLVPLFLGCKPGPQAAADAPPKPPLTPKELYEARCSACHQLYPLDSRTKAQWDVSLDGMSGRAGLNPAQIDAIRAWLHQNAKQ
jgi:mono/diheme cytochrome c family protein